MAKVQKPIDSNFTQDKRTVQETTDKFNIIHANAGAKNILSICNVYLHYIPNPHKGKTAAARAERCVVYIGIGRYTTDMI
jgi:hypothetical protein